MGSLEIVGGVPRSRRGLVAVFRQLLERKGANRLQHREVRFPLARISPHQALRQQRLQVVEDLSSSYGASRGQGEPADEDAQSPEQVLRVGIEQGVAPADRVAQRLL